MKAKQVIMQVEVMTEAVVKELNEVNERIDKLQSEKDYQYDFLLKSVSNIKDDIQSAAHNRIKVSKDTKELTNRIDFLADNKSNKSETQTIAKHVQELEEKVDKLENYIYAQEKPKIAVPNVKEVCYSHAPNARNSMMIQYALATGTPLVDLIKLSKEQIEYLKSKGKHKPDYYQKAKSLLIEYAEKTMDAKGEEYTPYGDRFDNFRPILGEKKTAIENLINWCGKHVHYCHDQESTPSYPSDAYKRENTFIGKAFGFGKNRKYALKFADLENSYKTSTLDSPKFNEDGGEIEYSTFDEFINGCVASGQCEIGHIGFDKLVLEIPRYYKQCYINELLEHWGDVFNYNVLGLAMQNTDKPNSVVPYADRATQEKEIKGIVDSAKQYHTGVAKGTNYHRMYELLLNRIDILNLEYIVILFAKQLERLENQK